MIRLLSSFLLLISLTGFSQNYIGKTKSQVKEGLNKYLAENDNVNGTLNESDTSLTLIIKGTATLPADFFYKFNRDGKCVSEKTTAYCDSCYSKFLATALNNKKYGWKKINGNQYVSNFASQMLIELPVDDKDLSFIIIRTNWNKEMYKSLKEQ